MYYAFDKNEFTISPLVVFCDRYLCLYGREILLKHIFLVLLNDWQAQSE